MLLLSGGEEVRGGGGEVAGARHGDGTVGEGDDLVDEAAAEVDGGRVRGGRVQLLLEPPHQVLHAPQLRHEARTPAALPAFRHCCCKNRGRLGWRRRRRRSSIGRHERWITSGLSTRRRSGDGGDWW
nr:unnamed protein product [Digitaria exilis]